MFYNEWDGSLPGGGGSFLVIGAFGRPVLFEVKEMHFNAYLVSDVGKVRKNNEDNYNFFGVCREDTNQKKSSHHASGDTSMAAVAVYDGMGGESAGEVASLIAARYLHPCAYKELAFEPLNQIYRANDAVRLEMEKRGGATMGCTAAAIYMSDDKARIVNLGDSRCYLYRGGNIEILSHDHSEAQDYIDDHSITEVEAKKKRSWHVLTRYLGGISGTMESEPYVSDIVDLCPGDIFVLCTDGLTDMVSDAALRAILSSETDPEALACDMVDMALMAGGNDNITVVVIHISND